MITPGMKSATTQGVQTTLDNQVVPLPEQAAPYSDALFAEAAEDWLIATDQVSRSSVPLPLAIYQPNSRLTPSAIRNSTR